jgi:hypothetical protein
LGEDHRPLEANLRTNTKEKLYWKRKEKIRIWKLKETN